MLYLPQLKGEQLPPIYLLVGQDDKNYLEENQKFAEELKAKGAPYELHIVAADHRTKEYLPDFLVFASKHLTMEG
jgi:enterochelin esterase-like enzyme